MTIGQSTAPYRWFVKLFARYSPPERMIRLGRVVWAVGEGPGTGKGYSAKLSLALRPSLFGFRRECDGWIATAFGFRLHYSRSYGGWIQ
jgi:hypothetical protein